MVKKSQHILAALALLLIIALGIKVYLHKSSLLPIWLIGITIGFVLYRSGICFASMFQDIFLFRNFSMFRAVLIMILISLIGINIIQIYAHLNGNQIPGKFHSVGIHTAAGSFIFGIGMILAGGCASGTLQRIGEGFLMFVLVLLGMIIGSIFGAFNYSWWITNFYTHKAVFLPDEIGWIGGGLLSLAILIALYVSTYVLANKKTHKKRSSTYAEEKTKPHGRGLSDSTIDSSK